MSTYGLNMCNAFVLQMWGGLSRLQVSDYAIVSLSNASQPYVDSDAKRSDATHGIARAGTATVRYLYPSTVPVPYISQQYEYGTVSIDAFGASFPLARHPRQGIPGRVVPGCCLRPSGLLGLLDP